MSYHLEIPPVRGKSIESQQLWLEDLRQRLLFLLKSLNNPGCGLYFDDQERLAVKHDSSITCDTDDGLHATGGGGGGASFNDAEGDPADVDTAPADGVSTFAARRDHVHQLKNDVVTTSKIADDAVTYAKIQNVSTTDRLLGRDAAGAGNAEELTVGGGVEFTGAGGIQRSALTGDVTAGAGSSSTTIANDAVTFAKMQDIATDRLIGRDTAGSGNPEELTVGGGLEFTGAGGIQRSALTGDVTAGAGSNATSLTNDSVKDTTLRDSLGLSVIGRAANSVGDPGDIVAGTDAHVLRRSGTTLGFGTLSPSSLDDKAVTDAKLRDSSGLSVIGRAANTTGAPADIVAASDNQVLRRSGTAVGFGTVATAGIADNAVTDAKIRDSSALSVIGRSANSTGDPADIAAATNGHVLRRASNVLGFGDLSSTELGFTDPNSHFQASNSNLVDIIEELGFVLAEQTRRWPHVSFHPYTAFLGGSLGYTNPPNRYGCSLPDAAWTTLGWLETQIPIWYLKSGSNVYTLDLYYWVSAAPGSDLIVRIHVNHSTFSGGDTGFGTITYSNFDITIPSAITANAPVKTTINITSGDFGSGKENVTLYIARDGTHANDTYTGTVYMFGVGIRSGVKAT